MKKILRWLDENLEAVVSVALMTIMTIIIFIQVIMRYVFQHSLTWSEEFARYCFIWLVYIGASYACKKGAHIKIDAALRIYPEKLRKYIVILGDLCVLILAGYIMVTGMRLVNFQVAYHKVSPAMGLPLAFVNFAPVAGFGLIVIRQAQTIWKRVRALPDKNRSRALPGKNRFLGEKEGK